MRQGQSNAGFARVTLLALAAASCSTNAATNSAPPQAAVAGQGAVLTPNAATGSAMQAGMSAPASANAPMTLLVAGQAAPAKAPPASASPPSAAAGAPVAPAMQPSAPAAAMAPPAMTKPAEPPGPDDGDPAKPMVALTEVPCRASGGFGFPMANFKVDDRDVIIDYPCNKHEGAPMTFILNLHGTTPVAQHFYQEGYFSAFKYVGSHNLIIATPSSVVEQWGNGDNGADQPYLDHVIDWVYKTLGTKFDIRSMWVGGHSWGAFYTSQFGCRPELADKVKGIIIMSGSPTQPACAAKMSVIDTNAEMDIGPPLEQGAIPMQHGCKAAVMNMLGNNKQTLWPDCMVGYTHSNYLMLGKMHIDSMDDVVVKSIVDLIKSVRP